MTTALPAPNVRPGLTLWFGTALAAWIISSWSSYAAHDRSLLLHVVLVVPAFYFLCICVHDAVHGVLHRVRAVNQASGLLLSMVVGLPFPLLQSTHLTHHRTVGSSADPEAIIYRLSPWLLPLRLPIVPFYYLRGLADLGWGARGVTLLHVTIIGAACALGGPDVWLGWALPALLAIMWFGFTTIYVPHSRYASTLMQYFRGHSGWHDDHHRSPRYPFGQYAEVRAWHFLQGVEATRTEAVVIGVLSRRLW